MHLDYPIKAFHSYWNRKLEQPILFLSSPPPPKHLTDGTRAEARRIPSENLDKFYTDETRTLGEAVSHLTKPSRPVDAEVPIILYCQTKEGGICAFHDEDSQTIQLQFAFRYDWHRRGEDNFRGRGRCPTAKRGPEVKTS
ncbi:hypothetical protein F4779DRAFT_273978 [Xylariaceae sp. FL0662B]|nr:hypothetical protein F4779DRAFT_273978 [Xylariaceae sp. FL0662B]